MYFVWSERDWEGWSLEAGYERLDEAIEEAKHVLADDWCDSAYVTLIPQFPFNFRREPRSTLIVWRGEKEDYFSAYRDYDQPLLIDGQAPPGPEYDSLAMPGGGSRAIRMKHSTMKEFRL